MTKQELTALLGFHDTRSLDSVVDLFKTYGYQVTTAQTPQEYMQKVKEQTYDFYCMDTNLGSFGSDDPTPSVEVYKIIKERVESGQTKFLALTNTPKANEEAVKRGIPKKHLEDKCAIKWDDWLK